MSSIQLKCRLLLAGILLHFSVQAQQKPAQHMRDVVYLKNGGVIRGVVIATTDSTIKMENRIRDTLVFAASEVANIIQEKVMPKISAHGFYVISEVGGQFSGDKGLVIRCIPGYRFAYQWQAGAGIGLDDYQMRSAPVFADLRYDFSRHDRTFFVYSGAGAAFPWPSDKQLINMMEPDKKEAGFYLHAGLGYKLRWLYNDAFHVSAGYSQTAMKLKYAIRDWSTGEPLGTYTTYNYSFNRVTITVGCTF